MLPPGRDASSPGGCFLPGGVLPPGGGVLPPRGSSSGGVLPLGVPPPRGGPGGDIPPGRLLLRAVRFLLECILVFDVCHFFFEFFIVL